MAEPEGMRPQELTAKDKILLHLLPYAGQVDPDSYIAPLALTQEGVSDALAINRSYISVTLRNLTDENLVEEIKCMVQGGNRRRKVYIPTAMGVDRAKPLFNVVQNMEVTVAEGEKATISTLVEREGIPMVEVLSSINEDGIYSPKPKEVTAQDQVEFSPVPEDAQTTTGPEGLPTMATLPASSDVGVTKKQIIRGGIIGYFTLIILGLLGAYYLEMDIVPSDIGLILLVSITVLGTVHFASFIPEVRRGELGLAISSVLLVTSIASVPLDGPLEVGPAAIWTALGTVLLWTTISAFEIEDMFMEMGTGLGLGIIVLCLSHWVDTGSTYFILVFIWLVFGIFLVMVKLVPNLQPITAFYKEVAASAMAVSFLALGMILYSRDSPMEGVIEALLGVLILAYTFPRLLEEKRTLAMLVLLCAASVISIGTVSYTHLRAHET